MRANANNRVEMEQGESVAEVATQWSGTTLEVKQLGMGRGDQRQFEIGEETTCDCWISPELLSERSRLTLVKTTGKSTILQIPTIAQVTLERPEMHVEGLDELIQLGLAKPCSSGIVQLILDHGWVIKITLGEITFHVRRTEGARLEKAAAPMDWSSVNWTGASFLVHGIFLALVFAIPPLPNSISLSGIHQGNRFVSYLVAPPEIVPPEVPQMLRDQPAAQTDEPAEQGSAHAGEGGMMGDPNSSESNRHYTIRNRGGAELRLSRNDLRNLARNSGILAALRTNAPSSPFSNTDANGFDAEDQLGALLGDLPGTSFGYGGLTISGTGRGGNGIDGNISLGTLNTIGRVGSRTTGDRAQHRAHLTRHGHRSSGPTVRHGVASVSGTLPREAIRRQIRLRRAEIAHCYQRELNARPDLEGRVSIRFVIDQRGHVINAVVSDNSVGSPAVGQCVSNVIRRMSFPAPGDGVVVVNYPFTFISQD